MRIGNFWIVILMAMSTNLPLAGQQYDIQGHRGARGLWPENTLPAFQKAVEWGITTVELDVVITQDNHVVVSHEAWMSSTICLDPLGKTIPPELERTHNIYQMTYSLVQQYDCGIKFHPRFPHQHKQEAKKPLLEDVLKAVERMVKENNLYEVQYSIEIKSFVSGDGKFHPRPQEFSELVYAVIDAYLPWERVIIQSFDFRILRYWRQKYPEVKLAALVENKLSAADNLKNLGFFPSIFSPQFTSLDARQMAYLKERGIRVIPWTVNEAQDMARMISLGVDGLITDYPDRAAQLGLIQPYVLE
jgi:glycerophosphoryl diester phosphodiesterase